MSLLFAVPLLLATAAAPNNSARACRYAWCSEADPSAVVLTSRILVAMMTATKPEQITSVIPKTTRVEWEAGNVADLRGIARYARPCGVEKILSQGNGHIEVNLLCQVTSSPAVKGPTKASLLQQRDFQFLFDGSALKKIVLGQYVPPKYPIIEARPR